MAAGAAANHDRLVLDNPPGVTVSHQGGQNRVVELVTATHRAIKATERQSGQGEVADGIENLVAGALVGRV